MWIKKRSARTKLGSVRAAPEPRTMGPLREYEQLLVKSVAGNDASSIPNAAVIAANRDGKIIHSFSAGVVTSADAATTSASATAAGADVIAKETPFTIDTVCWIASCTKVMVTVAALQCVERGLLGLDAPVGKILPELENNQILLSVDDDGAKFKPATKKITLRQLLTHSAGLSYEFTHPKMFAWRRWFIKQSPENKEMTKSREAGVAYRAPLLFEPGEGWAYSTGLDWTGVMIERVTGLSLESYMRKNIWDPLDMRDTTFYPSHLANRLSSMAMRDDEGNLTRGVENPLKAFLGVRESGGGGCFSTARDYVKFLSSLLSPTSPILSPATQRLMFQPHLSPSSQSSLMTTHASPLAYGLSGNLPIGTKLSYGLGGILNLEDIRNTGRQKGTMQWGGLPNLFWWVSPADGVCGCYFSQLLPSGDRRSFELYEQYERAVLGEFGKGRGKL